MNTTTIQPIGPDTDDDTQRLEARLHIHRMLVPVIFTCAIGIGLAPLAPVPLALFIGGLSWMAHIALDRSAGYGLRNADGSRGQG